MDHDIPESPENDTEAWLIEIKTENVPAFEAAAKSWNFGGTIQIANLFDSLDNKDTMEEWIYTMHGKAECLSAFVKEHEHLYERMDNSWVTLDHCC